MRALGPWQVLGGVQRWPAIFKWTSLPGRLEGVGRGHGRGREPWSTSVEIQGTEDGGLDQGSGGQRASGWS